MKLTLGRFFGQHGAEMVVIDPGIETLGDRVLPAAPLRARR
jgi:hypothetical protein